MTDINANRDDEVSLKEFKSQVNQFRSFLRQIVFGAIDILKHYYILVLLMAGGFACLAFYQYKYQRSYKARTSFIYIESEKKVYGEMIDNLQEMIKTHSSDQVAKALKISLPLAQNIYGLDAVNSQGAKLSEDVTESIKGFYVVATAGKRSTFDSLQPALEQYLNSNPLIQRKMEGNRLKVENDIAYFKQELAKLDSLKTAYTNSLDKPNSTITVAGAPFNPTQIYEKSEKLNTEISNLQALLNSGFKAVQLREGFMVSSAPTQSLFAILMKCAVFFLVATFALIFIISIFRK